MLAGLLAIFSVKGGGGLSVAGGLIALCSLADTLDGKFSRLFKRTEDQKKFGVQLDSLTDAIAFGLAPVISYYLMISFASLTAHLIWLAAAFFYVISAITRLGVYNIQAEQGLGFIGLPTTVAGLIWSSFFLMKPSVALSAVLLLGCGTAMVSSIPVPRPGRLGMVAIMGWALFLMILHGAFISIATEQR